MTTPTTDSIRNVLRAMLVEDRLGTHLIQDDELDPYVDISRARILKAQLEPVPTLAGQAAFDLTELEEAELEL